MDVIEEDLKSVTESLRDNEISFDQQKILVTGGAGFLGSWTCDALIELGAKVICLDNFSSGQRKNIKHLEDSVNFRLVEHDITQPIFFDEKIDLILHLASRASPLEFTRFPIQIMKANTLGTWISLGIAKKHKARFVYASSSEIYGNPEPKHIPTPETYNGNVNPVGERSCYDEAKRAGEAFVTAYHIQHNLDTRIIRIFNTYGPRMRAGDVYGRVVTRFIDQALRGAPLTVFGDGHQTRSFAYVTDTIKGILKLANQQELTGEIINLGSQEEIEIIQLAKKTIELTESTSNIEHHPLPPDDPRRRCPDTNKAEELVDWNVETKLERGLRKTIRWFMKKH